MKLLPTITTEDRWVIGSIVLTFVGVILGARLAEPRAFGVTTLIVIGLLFIARSVTHSSRLSWLLVFGLVAGVMELWLTGCMWLTSIHSSIRTTSGSDFSPHRPICLSLGG